MIQNNVYRYVGENGILFSPVLLEGIPHTLYVKLSAEKGKILTDGERKVNVVTVKPKEVYKWQETDNDNK